MSGARSDLGAYRLIENLGEGPYGVVWLAEDSDAMRVALKLLKPAYATGAQGQKTYERLAQVVRRTAPIRHKNLVRVFRSIAVPDQHIFGVVREYVPGTPLSRAKVPERAVEGKDPRALAEVLSWIEQLGELLAWLHVQGIVHGNVKPNNAVLTPIPGGRHQPKLLDLCFSQVGPAVPSPGAFSTVSPEQEQGETATPLSDQWALAAVLKRLLSGDAPDLTLGTLPAVLVLTLRRALEKNPSLRFARMNDFVESLRAIRSDLEGSASARENAVRRLPKDLDTEPDESGPPRPELEVQPELEVIDPAPDKFGRYHFVPNDAASEGLAPFEVPSTALARPISDMDVPTSYSDTVPMAPLPADEAGQELFSAEAVAEGTFDELARDAIVDLSVGDAQEDRTVRGPKHKSSSFALVGGVLMLGAALILVFSLNPRSEEGEPHGTEMQAPQHVPVKKKATPITKDTIQPEVKAERVAPAAPKKRKPAKKSRPSPAVAKPVSKPPKRAPVAGTEDRFEEKAVAALNRLADRAEQKEPRGTETPKSQPISIGAKKQSPAPAERPREKEAKKVLEKNPAASEAVPSPEPEVVEPPLPVVPPPVAKPRREKQADARTLQELATDCDKKDGKACLLYGKKLLQKGDPTGRYAFEKACNNRIKQGCLEAGLLWRQDGNRISDGRAFGWFDRACKQRSAEGCHQTAGMWKAGDGVAAADAAQARRFEDRACNLGRQASCPPPEAKTSSVP